VPDVVKKRKYDSPVRQKHAMATRARIIEAAARLFLDAGYARTSTAAIARAAGTSEASVFAVFGSKADLLAAVVRDHVVRDPDYPLQDHPIWQRFAADPDKTPAMKAIAHVVRRAHDRSWRLLAVVHAAAGDDAALAAADRSGAQGRHDTCAWFVREVVGLAASEDTDRRIDAMWTLISVDNYRHLVIDRSWTAEQYEAWLATAVAATLR
jgi:TetR/AcrR family transcriptional regulator of autoinduction and epiphytic fitness